MFLTKQEQPRNDTKLNTIIGPGSHIKGDIEVQGGIRIDGSVEGNINATGPITVGRDGKIITPSITATSATVGGTIKGDISAKERIRLEPTANVEGNLITELLIVEEGAVFTGNSNMTEEKKGD